MKKKDTKLTFAIFALGSICLLNAKRGDNIHADYVPDAKTAIRVAEAIWLPVYGESIYADTPFVAKLRDGKVWVVHGTLPPDYSGGTAEIEIQKYDCKVLKVYHGK